MYIIVILIFILLIYLVIKFKKKNKKLPYKKYDIIYSILFHRNINYVNNCIENIKKYNKNNKFLIIAHLSDELYKKKKLINKKNVIINPLHFNKKKFGITILKAIIDNFEFLKNNKINYNYCMTLSSSCRFIKQTPTFNNKNNFDNIFHLYDPIVLYESTHSSMILNNEIYNIFDKLNMYLLTGQISGRLFSKNLINKVCNFFRNYNIFNKIQYDNVVFEEILLPTISNYYMKGEQKLFCHIFTEISLIPTISELKKKMIEIPSLFLVKKFPEDLNHPIYQLI